MHDSTIEKLEQSRMMANRSQVEVFEAALRDLSGRGDLNADAIARLYLVFNDESPQQDVLWGLLHLLEQRPFEDWLSGFVQVAPQMGQRSPEWLDTITSRILNLSATRDLFSDQISKSPESSNALRPVLMDLARQDSLPALKSAATVLLKRISKRAAEE